VTIHSDGAKRNNKFRFKTDRTATEIFQLIKQPYGDNAFCLARVFRGI
jgi:hypothetical protein